MTEGRRILWGLTIVVTIAAIYQLFFRYQYVTVTSTNPLGLSGPEITTSIRRIDRLTGQVCQVPCAHPEQSSYRSNAQARTQKPASAHPASSPTSWARDPDEDRTVVHLSQFDTLMLSRAVSGIVGPGSRWILAIPLSGGGSGGAFEARIYGYSRGRLQTIQSIRTDSGITSLTIENGRLLITTGHFLPADGFCCPSELDVGTYAMRNDQLSLVTTKTVATPAPIATATPFDPNVWAQSASSTRQRSTSGPTASSPLPSLPGNAPGASSECDSDTIDEVASDGSFVKMLSGDGYRISDADEATASLWLSTDDVTICDEGGYYRIIDGSDVVEAEKVDQ